MKKLYVWCRRYVSLLSIVVILFLSYMLLSQDRSIYSYMDNARVIDSLRTEIRNAADTVRLYQELNSKLTSDPELMEKVVREQYNMAREGEDVYVFKENP